MENENKEHTPWPNVMTEDCVLGTLDLLHSERNEFRNGSNEWDAVTFIMGNVVELLASPSDWRELGEYYGITQVLDIEE
jgi:hypothetical protein